MKWRITDCIRQQQKNTVSFTAVSELSQEQSDAFSPEDTLQAEERKKLINGAILIFEAISSIEARRIWMWSNGMSYKDMAMKEFAGQDSSAKEISSKESAIRKQFTRPQTGTLAKFRIVLERYLETKKLTINDILE